MSSPQPSQEFQPIRSRFDFASDNAAGVDERILAELSQTNVGYAAPYGQDEASGEIDAIYTQLFERECWVFATPTGTAANGLALGAMSPPYGAIFCHEKAHIVTTECGAPEFFSGGARLVLLPGASHKIGPGTLLNAIKTYQPGNRHQLRPSAISITQPTDGGTVYSCEELALLCRIARTAEMKVHMDGARFANAIAHLGVSAADLSWKAGVDVLSFGVTKNGGMCVEAVVCFDRQIALTLRYLHKRAGFLLSKMRFAAAQLRAYARGGLWLENARVANANAQRLATALRACPDVVFEDTVQANQLFVHLPSAVIEKLARAGLRLRPWPHPSGDLFRLVGSFCDSVGLLSRFEIALS